MVKGLLKVICIALAITDDKCASMSNMAVSASTERLLEVVSRMLTILMMRIDALKRLDPHCNGFDLMWRL